MQFFSAVKQWWNRHRTGEKTGAALTVVAILVGVYFGIHPLKSEDTSTSGQVAAQPGAPATPPPVTPPPAAASRLAAGNPCPAQGKSLQSDARGLSCEIISFCTESETKAPSSDAPGYEAYEEKIGREASARYYARLAAIVGKLHARGLQSDDVDSTLNDPDQDCDSLTTAANGLSQLADQLNS